MIEDNSETKMWLYALLFITALSIAVFLVQRFATPIFNLTFEVCIFYVPTIILLIIVLYQKIKKVKL